MLSYDCDTHGDSYKEQDLPLDLKTERPSGSNWFWYKNASDSLPETFQQEKCVFVAAPEMQQGGPSFQVDVWWVFVWNASLFLTCGR